MTAATLEAEAETIAQARSVLDLAEPLLDTRDGGRIRETTEHLRDRLEDYDLIGSGWIHPATEFPDLGYGHPDDAMDEALTRITGEVADLAGQLGEEIWEHRETKAASYTATRRAA